MRNKARWLPADVAQRDSSARWHGTAMLSLVAGALAGVAKKINPVIVPFSRSPVSPSDWLERLALIRDDLTAESSVATSVLLLSVYFPRYEFSQGKTYHDVDVDGFKTEAYLLLQELVRKGAVLVTGTGNYQHNFIGPVDGWPADFGKTGDLLHIPSLMVVGGIDSQGQKIYGRADLPNGLPQFYAPGVDVTVAEGNEHAWGDPVQIDNQYRSFVGTSGCKLRLPAELFSSSTLANVVQPLRLLRVFQHIFSD